MVFAWGLKNELKNSRALAASLSAKAIKKSEISYCLKIDPVAERTFVLSQMELEAQSALKLWSQSFANAGNKVAKIKLEPDCGLSDLVIHIGNKEAGDLSNGAYTQLQLAKGPVEKVNSKDFILIKINQDSVWNETRSLSGNRNGLYKFASFSSLTKYKKNMDLAALINWVSFLNPATVDQVSRALGISHGTVFWTTYRALLHEMGHAFGLCDTTKELFETQCDSKWSSGGPQEPSLMLNSNFFYITQDDKLGLRQLRQRIESTSGQ